MNTPTLLKKMSAKSLLGATKTENIKALIASGKIALGQTLFGVTGNVTEIKSGESTYGTWYGLVGDFYAKRVDTGEVFQSGQLFLDKGTTEVIKAKLAESQDGGGVDIALTVALASDPDSNTGYTYIIRPLSADPVNRSAVYLEKLGALAALPAPVADEPAQEGKKK